MRILSAGSKQIVGNFSIAPLLLMRQKQKSLWKAVQRDAVSMSLDHQMQDGEVDLSFYKGFSCDVSSSLRTEECRPPAHHSRAPAGCQLCSNSWKSLWTWRGFEQQWPFNRMASPPPGHSKGKWEGPAIISLESSLFIQQIWHNYVYRHDKKCSFLDCIRALMSLKVNQKFHFFARKVNLCKRIIFNGYDEKSEWFCCEVK